MPSFKGLSSRPWLTLFGVLLAFLCVLYWPDSHAKVSLSRRGFEVEQLDHLSDVGPSNGTLLARGAYQCGPGNPCGNGACCGKSGYCGYGAAYCGDGCVSNCDAHAECGEFAQPKGKKCPLNTCCSQYGFCGTTEEFCGKKCQSNCVLHPKPPGGPSSKDMLNNKVIGYYESWGRKACHRVDPVDLPLEALSHVNYAFAYIEPGSYKIVTMDAGTPASLFRDLVNLKSFKQDLKVWVSIGGWTFSNNNTDTQPLFGEIAADASKRKTFANNLVHFMVQYGFDGVDLDWEYPGAPDRGGHKRDTDNYVLLLKTMRETFDDSPHKFGISFTAPSSYWYLRWFDLPGLMKYADWVNVMTYDLHGVWDANNPIGNIVQGHTNLTEIKSALELYWRVDIPPKKVVMGFGFYGRSFTLADPSCTKPGCPFSGASNAGPCSNAAGMLAYYEIQQVLKRPATRKRAAIEPVYDEDAAVNYFTFDGNQWVSYDDRKTFKQKVDWANGVGLGGGLIWASDLDDDKYEAHSGLLGKEIHSTNYVKKLDKALSSPQAVIDDLAGINGQKCFKFKDHCIHLNDKKAMKEACGHGFTVVGWDDAGCGSGSCHCGKPVCCPVDAAPKNCIWRGDDNGGGAGTDCSAQCRPGEINIKGIKSSWGGGFLNDGGTDKCGRGYKVFCCPNAKFDQITDGCGYAKCGHSCSGGKEEVFKKKDWTCWSKGLSYCCPTKNHIQLEDCHWTAGGGGEADCANAVCKPTEIEVDRSSQGDGKKACDWDRQKAMCCTLKQKPVQPLTCSADLCTLGLSDYCKSEDPGDLLRRDLELVDADVDDLEDVNALEPRGTKPDWDIIITLRLVSFLIELRPIAAPELGRMFSVRNAGQILRRYIQLVPYYCLGPSLHEGDVAQGRRPQNIKNKNLHVEHPVDVAPFMKGFVKAAASGLLPSGRRPDFGPVPRNFWEQWNTPNAALGRREPIGSRYGDQPDTPNNRLMASFGTTRWPRPFLAVSGEINVAKIHIMERHNPVHMDRIQEAARTAVREDTEDAATRLLSTIRIGFATWDYLRHPDFIHRWNLVINMFRLQAGYIERDVGATNLVRWWNDFTNDLVGLIETQAQDWATQAINDALDPIEAAMNDGHVPTHAVRMLEVLREWANDIPNMTLPPPDTMEVPHPPADGGQSGSGGSGSGGSGPG